MDRQRREEAINLTAVFLAAAAACRIVAVCYRGGKIYSFGIFYLAVLFGIYCIMRKALFIREAFFAVWVRALLALFFTGMQVLGLYYGMPGVEGSVAPWEPVLWTVCLSPLAYGAQNALFAWVLAQAGLRRGQNNGFGRGDAAGGRDGKAPGAGGGIDGLLRGRNGHKTADMPEKDEFSYKKEFLINFLVILAGFAIPFATYYPAIMAYDVIPQLDQIKISGYTTHHPLIHTLFLSLSLKIGEMLPFVHNADRAGLAVYTVVQMLFVAGCFAWAAVFMRRKGVSKWVCRLFVLCAAFFPTHGMLAVSITKDTIYAALVMVFTVFVWDMITWRKDSLPGKGWSAAYTVLTALLLLFRNNSVYAWVLFLLAVSVCFFRKDAGDRRFFRRMCVLHGTAFLLYLLLNTGLAAASHATNSTYAREMLSVPAQQIARVAAYHEEELTEKDRENLAVIWGEGNLPEYVPAIADRSKRDIPNDKEALRVLAKEWASLGVRYPGEYVKAFLLKNKGMWHLEDDSYLFDVYSYAKGYLQITYPSDQQEYMEALVPGYVRHQRLQSLQSVYRYFAAADAVWRYIPPLALVMQPAFYCWLLFYYCLCCIGLKAGRGLIPAVYLLALAGTLLLGPCVLVRYVYPVMLAVTVMSLLALAQLKAAIRRQCIRK